MTTIVDEVYQALMEGQDFDRILEKWGEHKSSVYEAVKKYLSNIKTEIESLRLEKGKIAEEVAKAKVKLGGLTEDAERIEAEDEAAQRRLSELNQTEQNLNNKIGKLEKELAAKGELLNKARALEGAGFTTKRLEVLQEKVAKICARRGVDPKKAVDAFFKDLDAYDAKRGWGLELEQLKTLAKTKSSEVARWKAERKKLELQYADRKTIVDEMEGLMKQGVRGGDILAWGRILDAAGKIPEEFEEELEHYGEVENILRAKLKEIESSEAKISELKSKVGTLEKNKARIDFSIKALTISGIMEIEKMHEKVKGELTSLMEEVRRWGEIKAEAGKLEEELKIARYFAVKDPIMIKLLPKGAIAFLLEKVILWCELWGVNLEVKVPEWLSKKYLGISSWAEVGLADLLRWAYGGLLKVEVRR